MTTTVIIGNGIGMALDPKYFMLNAGLDKSWKSFSDEDKKIIRLNYSCCPKDETELENQHRILTSCKILDHYSSSNLNFLSPIGMSFSKIYQEFIYRVAKHFCDYKKDLSAQFIDKLCGYIKSDFPSHVATLNYDKLIYKSLVNKGFCNGYTGKLVDGIYNKMGTFSADNLLRTHNNFGWYLHLHGSPLFRVQKNKVQKENINDLLPDFFEQVDGAHSTVVLTHTKYKADVISGSFILATYFDFFIKALSESDKLIVIGYSGLDEHINSEIRHWVSDKAWKKTKDTSTYIKIVEWKGAGHNIKYWENLFFPKDTKIDGCVKIDLKQLPNILDYDFL